MSTIDDARELRQTAAPVGDESGLFRKAWRAVQQWRDRRALRAFLDDLSDRELWDIGITRGEIDYLTRAPFSADPRDCHR